MTNKEVIEKLLAMKKCGGLTNEHRHALNIAIKAIEFKDKAKIAYHNSDCYIDFINYFSVLLKEAENDSRTDFG